MIRPEEAPGVAFGTAADGDPRRDPDAARAIASELGIGSEWAWVRQVHGAGVATVAAPGIGGEADAVITMEPSLPVAVSVADCLPVAIVGTSGVGMAHAGWRGVVAGVVDATITAMVEAGADPHTAVIGPGIGPCCFEVGPDVAQRFEGRNALTTWGTTSVDLIAAVREQLGDLRAVGLGMCTHHDRRFHSFRRSGTASRQFGVTWLPPA
jgi:YfiH family protein